MPFLELNAKQKLEAEKWTFDFEVSSTAGKCISLFFSFFFPFFETALEVLELTL